MTDDQQARLECLKLVLAMPRTNSVTNDQLIEIARLFNKFINSAPPVVSE